MTAWRRTISASSILLSGFAALAGQVGIAEAQSRSSQASSTDRWSVSVHGGFLTGARIPDGAGQLPQPGAPYTPVLGGAPGPTSRPVPSFWFGDGAALFNEARMPSVAALTPIDALLQSNMARRGAGLTFGVSIGRALTDRFEAELSVESAGGHIAFDDDVRSTAELARDRLASSFEAMFTNNIDVTTSVAESDEGGGEVMVTGALRINLANGAAGVPYAVVGAGIARSTGAEPTLTLDARYHLSTSTSSIDSSDVVTVTVRPRSGAVFLAGAGYRRTLGARGGVRVEGRVHVIRDRTSIEIDTTAAQTNGSGQFAFVRGPALGPVIYFSSGLGVPSSLATALNDFETFRSSGTRTQISLQLGYDFRF